MTGQETDHIEFNSVTPDRLKGQWHTLKEASKITGKSVNALNILINRGRVDRVRKVKGKGGGKWLIHGDSIQRLATVTSSPCQVSDHDNVDTLTDQPDYDRLTPMIPLEHYEKRRDEWDRERDKLTQGLMMYQYKLEEYERKIKLLPAPVEVVTKRIEDLERTVYEKSNALTEKEESLMAEVEYRQKLSSVLHSQEARLIELESELREARKPWWKKLLGLK